jgi:hypothetical protein
LLLLILLLLGLLGLLVLALSRLWLLLGRPGRAAARGASTQVSFEPPPWLELTTREPSTRATRVRPPGNTHTLSPSLTANGRRST